MTQEKHKADTIWDKNMKRVHLIKLWLTFKLRNFHINLINMHEVAWNATGSLVWQLLFIFLPISLHSDYHYYLRTCTFLAPSSPLSPLYLEAFHHFMNILESDYYPSTQFFFHQKHSWTDRKNDQLLEFCMQLNAGQ